MNTAYYVSRLVRHPKIALQVNLLECGKSILRGKVCESDFVMALAGNNAWGGFEPRFNESDPTDKYHKARKKRVIYYLIKNLKPKIVVETGVCAGHCSGYILQAMNENGQGKLYSIDKLSTFDPVYHDLPYDKQIGYVVPESLRERWELHLNGSENELPELLESLDSIDLFIHDSLHTVDMMLFEYALAWEHLKTGGILISHDVWRPFVLFCKLVNRKPIYHDVYGAITK